MDDFIEQAQGLERIARDFLVSPHKIYVFTREQELLDKTRELEELNIYFLDIQMRQEAYGASF